MFKEKNSILGNAANLIEIVTQTFENSRSTLFFNNLWLQIKNFAQDYNIDFNTLFKTQSTFLIICIV